jgi:hypothetical protein
MADLTAHDIHPPLYYALLHLWTGVLGTEPIVLRLLSVFASALAIPAVCWAGTRILSRREGLIAAALLALSPLHIYYSQEVRMYGLVSLLAILTLGTAWKVMASDEPSLSRINLAYVLWATLGLYTQYYFAFLPVGLTIYALWHWRRDRSALHRWVALQMALLLLYLPWLIYAGPRLVSYVGQKVVLDADQPLGIIAYFSRHLAAFLAGHLEGPLAPYWPWALLLLLPIGLGVAWRARSSPRDDPRPERGRPSPLAMLGVSLASALLLGWVVGLRYPFFPQRGERLLLFALPVWVLLAAAGIEGLLRRRLALGWSALALVAVVAGVSLAAFYTVPRYEGDDYRPLIARSVEQGLPEDQVLCVYPWQVGYWRAYGSESGPRAALLPDDAWSASVAAELDAALARGRVWFPAHLALGGGLENAIEGRLATGAAPFINSWYGPGTRLSAWSSLSPVVPVARVPLTFDLPMGGVVTLAEAQSDLAAVPAANSILPLRLRWTSAETPQPLTVSVRLRDSQGYFWAQHDYELQTPGYRAAEETVDPIGISAGWSGEDRLGLLIPLGTPPGSYSVEIALQAVGGTHPLPVTAAGGSAILDAGVVSTSTVAPADRVLGPERLPIEHRADVPLGDRLQFLGHSRGEEPVIPGELRKISLFWQAQGTPAGDYKAFLQLLDDAGSVLAGWEAPPGGSYATANWQPGTLMRTQAALLLPPGLQTGRYRLIAGLFDPSNGERLMFRSGDHLELGRVRVAAREHVMTPPKVIGNLRLDFGGLATLIGYEIFPAEFTSGQVGELNVTLNWRARASADISYTVFVHLVDEDHGVRGYGDSEPGGGTLPTTGWMPGEYLSDSHTVRMGGAIPPGRYRVVIGLYDRATGQRLTLPDGADSWELPQSVIVR